MALEVFEDAVDVLEGLLEEEESSDAMLALFVGDSEKSDEEAGGFVSCDSGEESEAKAESKVGSKAKTIAGRRNVRRPRLVVTFEEGEDGKGGGPESGSSSGPATWDLFALLHTPPASDDGSAFPANARVVLEDARTETDFALSALFAEIAGATSPRYAEASRPELMERAFGKMEEESGLDPAAEAFKGKIVAALTSAGLMGRLAEGMARGSGLAAVVDRAAVETEHWRKLRRVRRRRRRERNAIVGRLHAAGIGVGTRSDPEFTTTPVPATSRVYESLVQLFAECDMELVGLDKISNPTLEHRYRVAHELLLARHIYEPDFDPNERVLFHVTRAPEDIILAQGLDQRMSQSGGNFGAGIYLSDDPRKCNQYWSGSAGVRFLLVCSVYLGTVQEKKNTTSSSLRREPDGYDSVSGRVSSCGGWNEFVVYHSDRVLPQFVARYSTATTPSRYSDGVSFAMFPGEMLSASLPDLIALEFESESRIIDALTPAAAAAAAGRASFDLDTSEVYTVVPDAVVRDGLVAQAAAAAQQAQYSSMPNEVFAGGLSSKCVLCLHSLVDSAHPVGQLLKCKHTFHTTCLMLCPSLALGWLTCPLCNTFHGTKTGPQPDGGAIVAIAPVTVASIADADADVAAIAARSNSRKVVRAEFAFPAIEPDAASPAYGHTIAASTHVFYLAYSCRYHISGLSLAFDRGLVFDIGCVNGTYSLVVAAPFHTVFVSTATLAASSTAVLPTSVDVAAALDATGCNPAPAPGPSAAS